MPASDNLSDDKYSQSMVILVLILVLAGIDDLYNWMIGILYFTIAHSSFILMGMTGLRRWLGQYWCYPLVSRVVPDNC